MLPSHLLIVAPSSDGHHPEYVRWIVDGALHYGAETVTVAGPTALVSSLNQFSSPASLVSALPLPEFDMLDDDTSLWRIGRRTQIAIQRAVDQVQPSEVLLSYLDHALLGLAIGLRFTIPVQISGILFRPTLHEPSPSGVKRSVRAMQKRILLRLAAANPHLHRAFTLDPDAVDALRSHHIPATFLPDPVEPAQPSADRDTVRAHFEVEPSRQLAVLFGSLEERKGVFELMEALCELAPEQASALTVVIVGQTYDAIRPRLLDAIAHAQQHSKAQILFQEAFIPDTDLVNLTLAADLVLAPYKGHVGSSGVILRASASGTPVLGPDTGLMHRDIVRHQLGVSVDTSNPTAIAGGLVRALNGEGFDPASAAAYAEAHSVDRFAETLFAPLSPQNAHEAST
ncbi:MAG: hypothetical protein Rubg2KO_34390 [Rubricoccaceae bacterium]